ncbi:hypothetical protein ILUMI_03402 [Ignelater luminosus]|uniref:PiggyBac transposable element-derived protein domain-containing protein n=1 Tax=Ignelater luminosus TaxID=2038154 RepID=A0A8K0DEQ2_IGNLU|nr:hypothetical protein ILUMI_03402 [Ignelater luminosus]
MSLPEKYKHFTSSWESVFEDKQILEELTSRLLIEEERAKPFEGDTSLVSTSKVNGTNQKGGGKNTVKCNFCRKPGDEFWNDNGNIDSIGLNSDVAKSGPIVTVNNKTNVLGRIINFADESDQEKIDNKILRPRRKETNSWYGKYQTKWSKIPSQHSRTLAHSIIFVLLRFQRPARQNQLSSPLELWQLLLPDSVLEEIVDFTNKKVETARRENKRFKRSRSFRTLLTPTFVKDIVLLEIKAFVGCLYLQGIYKFGHKDTWSLWAINGRGRLVFRNTMSLAKFSFLLACLLI